MNFLSHYSPLRSFPDYTGPHAVGSCDVEVPAHELDDPSESGSPDVSIGTVSFRIFYPCDPDSSSRPVKWIPSPQSKYASAYCRFLGATPRLADFLAYFPQFLYMTKIPVHRNARLSKPTTSTGRWPVVVFSHGLGGSRNAYSHICGSLASYGIVVIAPDHRDSSAPVSFIRATDKTEARTVGYKKYNHTPSPEVYQGRDAQLRIRLWEMGCIHDAIVRIDLGTCPRNLDPNSATKGKRTEMVEQFAGLLDLHRPGSIVWAGHSFGATTTVQFMKSTYYGAPSDAERGDDGAGEALFIPRRDAPLVKQITSKTVSLLLDMWCLPLRSRTTRWLWNKPLPCYDVTSATCAGGAAVLAVDSDAFFKWEGNLNDTRRAIAPAHAKPRKDVQWTPFFFYPETSAHLSQSDFGILFPWITARVLKTREPERMLQLNARAMLQCMRVNRHEVAVPQASDLEIEEEKQTKKAMASDETLTNEKSKQTPKEDPAILLLKPDAVRGWVWVPVAEPSGDSGSDSGSDIHVEQDYQTPAQELDEAEVLGHQTPGTEKDEAEVLGLGKTGTRGSRRSEARA